MEKKQTVMIPEFNHSTIQQILEANQRMIQILKDLQNQGFHGTQEQRIYQIRLSTNLTFLATIADALYQKGTSVTTGHSGQVEEIPKERSDIVKSLPPPVRIQITTDSITKPTCSSYYPVPPLVGQNPVQEMALSGYNILDAETSHLLSLQETLEPKDLIGKKRTVGNRPVLLQSIQEDSDTEDADYHESESDTDIL
jgi:hypothetical protein